MHLGTAMLFIAFILFGPKKSKSSVARPTYGSFKIMAELLEILSDYLKYKTCKSTENYGQIIYDMQ
ncbi:hypothetical protein [Ureibacillus chungkukjangi]|uniref:hypothetical protein n=1 Tax=Ureibacillus chungkukjangi TaxID=1202712 RepID=UPI0027B8BEA4|nr:hypothetical protein [Ureibacillus chungkukjangi]